MTEGRFDDLMRDAAQTYRKPPEPDFEAMWNVVSRETWGAARPTRRSFNVPRGIGIAATLLLGIGMSIVADRPLAEYFDVGSPGFGFMVGLWGAGSVVGSWRMAF